MATQQHTGKLNTGTPPTVAIKKTEASASLSALSTAIGVLVADAASPTQAHVNTANAALTSVTNALAADVAIIFDDTVITTREQLHAAAEAIAKQAGLR